MFADWFCDGPKTVHVIRPNDLTNGDGASIGGFLRDPQVIMAAMALLKSNDLDDLGVPHFRKPLYKSIIYIYL